MTATTAAKPENQWSALQVERLLAAHHSLKNTEEDAERLKGETTEAKKLREERWKSLDACISEAGEALKGELMDIETQRRIFALDADYRRAIEEHELVDRNYRRVLDQAKKLLERLRSIIELNRGEEDLYSHAQGATKGDAGAWLLVPLADIVGEMVAAAFLLAAVSSVEDFLVAAKSGAVDEWAGKGIKEAYTRYAGIKIHEYAESRGHADDLPKWFKSLAGAPPEVPDTKEDKPARAAASEEEQDAGDADGEPTEAPADVFTPFRRESLARLGADRGAHHGWVDGPFAFTDDLLAMTDDLPGALEEWRIGTPRLFLAFIDEQYEYRDADKIYAEMPNFDAAVFREMLDQIAAGLLANGTPAVWDLIDSLVARCAKGWEELTVGSRLAELATFPPEQRFGRDVPPEVVDAAGKVTRGLDEEWKDAKAQTKPKKRSAKYHAAASSPTKGGKKAAKVNKAKKKAARKGKK